MSDHRPGSLCFLAAAFGAFVLILYGPIASIVILSFQRPAGGLALPLSGVSTDWFVNLFQRQAVGDLGGSFSRSLFVGLANAGMTVLIATLASYAFQRRFRGAALVFYLAITRLIVPSILVSLGIGLMFQILGIQPASYNFALGAHLTWTLLIGLLIVFAVFNRFDRSWQEAARDHDVTPWQTFRHGVLPVTGPSLIGLFILSITLGYDEFVRMLMTAGSLKALPLENHAMATNVTTPVIYALGSLTTGFSLAIVVTGLGARALLHRGQHDKRVGKG